MGRRNTLPQEHTRASSPKLHLVRLKWVDGDYDEQGAYWGNPGGSFIYRAASREFGYDIFVRASSRTDAKAKVRQTVPAVRFYR